ncbi:unnamed protein product [Protopolystoma xenopodis]|uniref:Uncharacterized protein n=1 Tax=Protopolystoma xenopodis TaxID=117903 RepID=A0A3S5ADV9_9PLAT|nr:unnamed protein product [Protopolystoma xenopodis]
MIHSSFVQESTSSVMSGLLGTYPVGSEVSGSDVTHIDLMSSDAVSKKIDLHPITAMLLDDSDGDSDESGEQSGVGSHGDAPHYSSGINSHLHPKFGNTIM